MCLFLSHCNTISLVEYILHGCCAAVIWKATWHTAAFGGIQTTMNTAAVSTLQSHSLASTNSTDVHMPSTTYATMTCRLINTRRSSITDCLGLAYRSTAAPSVTSHIPSPRTIQVAARKANFLDSMAACTTKMVLRSSNTMVWRGMSCIGWREIPIYHRCPMPILWWRNTLTVIAASTHRQGAPSTADVASRQLGHNRTSTVWRCHDTPMNQSQDSSAFTVGKITQNE